MPSIPAKIPRYSLLSHCMAKVAGLPLVSGREFGPLDTGQGEPVAIVDREFAHRYFSDRDPMGKHIRLGELGSDSPWRTVVGLTGNIKETNPFDPAAGIPMQRFEIGILFDGQIDSGPQPVVNSFPQKRKSFVTAAFMGQIAPEVVSGACRQLMPRPQDTTFNIQCLANQLLRFGVVAPRR